MQINCKFRKTANKTLCIKTLWLLWEQGVEGSNPFTPTNLEFSRLLDENQVAFFCLLFWKKYYFSKDLSYVNISGRTRVGYEVNELVRVLERFLGFTNPHKAFLFGVGRLGGALLHDNGLLQFGLEIVAGFDVKYELAGSSINRIPVHHISRFPELREQTGVDIGILTVPVEKAQSVCDMMIEGGIKAVWNFTPFRIRVPENVVVQNTSIYAHLAVMFNRLNTINEIEQKTRTGKQ